MTDSFEKALEEALLAGRANGGVENEQILNVIFALKQTLTVHLDAVEKSLGGVISEVKVNRRSVGELMVKHQASYMHMTKQEFEVWVAAYGEQRDAYTKNEHDKRHSDYLAVVEGERRSKMSRIKRRLENGGWQVFIIILSAFIALWATTFWADSCASTRVEKNLETHIIQSPAP